VALECAHGKRPGNVLRGSAAGCFYPTVSIEEDFFASQNVQRADVGGVLRNFDPVPIERFTVEADSLARYSLQRPEREQGLLCPATDVPLLKRGHFPARNVMADEVVDLLLSGFYVKFFVTRLLS